MVKFSRRTVKMEFLFLFKKKVDSKHEQIYIDSVIKI